MKNIKIIGIGGIGTELVNSISHFLHFHSKKTEDTFKIFMYDGDEFEDKNKERQFYIVEGNKARSKEFELKERYDNIQFEGISQYITINSQVFEEGDIVFCCVDNHKTRKVVFTLCEKLNNVCLFSGGNEYTDGNVQLYIKKGGEELTTKITDYHPEIENPVDRSPEEMSCVELQESSVPQLKVTNKGVSFIMECILYNLLCERYNGSRPIPSEIYFDITTLSISPKFRKTNESSNL